MYVKEARGDLWALETLINAIKEVFPHAEPREISPDLVVLESEAKSDKFVTSIRTRNQELTARLFYIGEQDKPTEIASVEGILSMREMHSILNKLYRAGENSEQQVEQKK